MYSTTFNYYYTVDWNRINVFRGARSYHTATHNKQGILIVLSCYCSPFRIKSDYNGMYIIYLLTYLVGPVFVFSKAKQTY